MLRSLQKGHTVRMRQWVFLAATAAIGCSDTAREARLGAAAAERLGGYLPLIFHHLSVDDFEIARATEE